VSRRGHDRPEVIDLARSSDEIQRALAGFDAEQLARRPAPGEWSAWDIAYHLAQIEVWYFAKLCEAASDDPPSALARFMRALGQMRSAGVAVASAIPEERLDTPGLLGGVPDWTPRQLLERIAAHDREHAAQVIAAAGAEQGECGSG
jgi:hypothetical protein